MCKVFLQYVQVGVVLGSPLVCTFYHTGHICEVFLQHVQLGAVSGRFSM